MYLKSHLTTTVLMLLIVKTFIAIAEENLPKESTLLYQTPTITKSEISTNLSEVDGNDISVLDISVGSLEVSENYTSNESKETSEENLLSSANYGESTTLSTNVTSKSEKDVETTDSLDFKSSKEENQNNQNDNSSTINTVSTDPPAREHMKLCNLGCDCPTEIMTEIFLDCGGRHIRNLPNGISFPSQLKSITFQKNDLKNISEYTFMDGALVEELDFADNDIQLIQANSFKSFKSLIKLRLTNNRLSNLSPGILQGLSDLRELEIGNNQIVDVSSSFFAPVKNLRELRIPHNNLKVLPEDTFKFLANLEKLDLGGNELKTLQPKLFEPTPHLNWLSLVDNSFEDVPKLALFQSKKLNLLDLSGNRFRILSRESFASIYSISSLYLNNIQTLERIQEFTFANITNLKILYCSYNKKLYYIHPNAFGVPGRKPKIDQLFLRQNSLNHLPEPQHIDTWSSLSYADLRENPWICDCNLRWMKKIRQEIFSTVRCESPLNMHGRSFPSLEEADLECNNPWMISTIILGLTSVLVVAVCLGFVAALVCSRASIVRYVKARSQFMYSKVSPKTEVVDLEWDPSADI